MSLRELDAEAAPTTPTRAHVLLGINGMVSQRNEHAIEQAISKLPGIYEVDANFPNRSLRVEFDRNQCALPEIVRRLDQLGFSLRAGGPLKTVEVPTPSLVSRCLSLCTARAELTCAVAGSFLLIAAVLTRWLEGPPAMRYAFVSAAFVVAGWFTAIDTFRILRQLKFDIDVLMFAAAFGAAAIGHPEEGALLLVLFAFGGAGEAMAMDRARSAIEKLTKLAPDTATVRDDAGNERLVHVEELAIGDRILVRPFDRVAADGTVTEGTSAVDQAPITGESVPVEKSPGEPVFAGTINGQGLLVVRVTKTSAESTLSKIIRLVNEAQATKSPTQLFTDRIERYYVPFVLAATAALIVMPPLIQGGNWSTWFYRAMAFLTAASPCALAIGTPAAVLCGIARAAQIGVLVKGGAHLETLGRVRTVALDKTGTLTRGRPQVTSVTPLDGMPESELLRLAGAVEQVSTHPLAAAIVAEARHRNLELPDATDVEQVAGRGIRGRISGKLVDVGRADASLDGSIVSRLHADGNTVVQINIDDRPAGVIGLADRPRDNAADSIARLKRIGVERCIMLTGDNRVVAGAIARSLGIDEVHAELMPEEKLRIVNTLRDRYGKIAMIGDGVNDAPALAAADVGIAMGGAGTDVALETADVALMADDLGKLPDAIGLSRFSRRIITQNLVIALGVIAVLAPLSALGFTYLGVAVLFHEGSTVVVVLNAMRILLYGRRK